MKTILGIDYGRKKIGLSLATTSLAEAYGVIRFEKIDEAINKIKEVVRAEQVEEVVVGISEGKMALETRKFARTVEKETGLKPFFQDETLSTKLAQKLSLEAQIRRKKRKELEDAFTAAIILQDYLDAKIR